MTESSPPPSGGGLLSSMQGLASTVLGILRTRLELFSVELEEEKLRLLRMLAWGGIAIFLGCIGLVFLAAFVCVLFWDEHRLLALGLMTLMFWGLAGMALWRVRSSAQASDDFLSASLAELQRDIEALKAHQKPNAEPPQT